MPALRIGLMISLICVFSAMFYFAAIDNSPLPYHPKIDGWNDLVLHVGAFAVLTAVALLIWPLSWTMVLILLLAGCLMELVQLFVPSREVDLLDVIANASGIFLGCALIISARWLIDRAVGDHAKSEQ